MPDSENTINTTLVSNMMPKDRTVWHLLLIFSTAGSSAGEFDGLSVVAQHNDTVSSILIRSYIAPNSESLKVFKNLNSIQDDELLAGKIYLLPRPYSELKQPEITPSIKAKALPSTEQMINNVHYRNILYPSSIVKNRNTDNTKWSAMTYDNHLNFNASRYIYDHETTRHQLTTELARQLNSWRLEIHTTLDAASDLAGSIEQNSLLADMNLTFAATRSSSIGLDTTLKSTFDRTADNYRLSAAGLEINYTGYFSESMSLAVWENIRNWNTLEDYAIYANSSDSTYKTLYTSFEFNFNHAFGLGLYRETGDDNGQNFAINTLTGWFYITDKAYISLSKTNQPDFYHYSATFEHHSNNQQSTALGLALGEETKSADLSYNLHNTILPDSELEFKAIFDYSSTLSNQLATAFYKRF